MTSASSLAYPGSRTLAMWWRQLAPYKPQSLSVGYLFVHRVEAGACWRTLGRLDPLLGLVLEAVAIEEQATEISMESGWQRLQRILRLDFPVLARLVHTLGSLHLVDTMPELPDCRRIPALTDDGRDCLRTGQLWSRQWRRDVFTFAEKLDSAGHRQAPPHFLRIQETPASPWPMENGPGFDVAWLSGCLRESDDWKKRFGFPADVVAFAAAGAEQSLARDQIVLDKTERLLVAFCHVAGPEPELLGFGARPEGWALNAAEPIIRLPALARLFSELENPDLAVWQAAWQAWCQTRGLPAAEARASTLSVCGERLHVRMPASLSTALQSAKSDVLKGDTWIKAGEGYVRRAGRVEVEVG